MKKSIAIVVAAGLLGACSIGHSLNKHQNHVPSALAAQRAAIVKMLLNEAEIVRVWGKMYDGSPNEVAFHNGIAQGFYLASVRVAERIDQETSPEQPKTNSAHEEP